ncbi:uncharacterized protein LOC135828266 isoform X2 [Sycon ciliatum]|uniref:uncharacterized protein LOC135828266 isoform X2 n=1 Tax=Sycon ciliatum TaxID=27933 RepID=UPI0031F6A27D
MLSTKPKKKRQEPWDWVDDVQSDILSLEVNPDLSSYQTQRTGLVERMAASKLARREEILKDFHRKCDAVIVDVNRKVAAQLDALQEALHPHQAAVRKISTFIESVDVTGESLFDMDEILKDLQSQSEQQRDHIKASAACLEKIEQERGAHLRPLVEAASQEIDRYGAITLNDVELVMSEETLRINEELQKNRSAISNMKYQLSLACLEKEKEVTDKMITMHSDWKVGKRDELMLTRREDVLATDAPEPMFLPELLDRLSADWKPINEKRAMLLSALKEFYPPKSTKAFCRKWQDDMAACFKQLEAIWRQFLDSFTAKMNAQSRRSEDTLRRKKEEIVDLKLSTQQEADNLMNDADDQFLVDTIRDKNKKLRLDMDKAFKEQLESQTNCVKELYDLMLGLAVICDQDVELKAKKDDRFKMVLQDAKDDLGKKQQKVEDEVADGVKAIREAETMENVREEFQRVKEIFKKFDTCQNSYDARVEKILSLYPNRCMDVVTALGKALLAFFGLRKGNKVYFGEEPPSLTSTPDSGTKRSTQSQASSKTRRTAGTASKLQKDVVSKSQQKQANAIIVPCSDGEVTVFETKGKNAKSRPSVVPKVDPVFLTESETDVAGSVGQHLLGSMDLEFDINEFRLEWRMEFLKVWAEEEVTVRKHVKETIEIKKEVLKVGREVQKGVYESRVEKVELNVVNVRAAEIKQNAEHVQVHIAKMKEKMEDAREDLGKVKDRLVKESKEVSARVPAYLERLRAATSLEKLKAVKRAAAVEFKEFGERLAEDASVEEDKIMNKIQGEVFEAHATMEHSLRPFADGGSYSMEELLEYFQELASLKSQLDKTQAGLKRLFEGLRSRLISKPAECASTVDKAYQAHALDIDFKLAKAKVMRDVMSRIHGEMEASNGQCAKIHELLTQTRAGIADLQDQRAQNRQQHMILDITVQLFRLAKVRADYLEAYKPKPVDTPAPPSTVTPKTASSSLSSRRQSSTSVASSDFQVTEHGWDPMAAINMTRGILVDQYIPAAPVIVKPGATSRNALRQRSTDSVGRTPTRGESPATGQAEDVVRVRPPSTSTDLQQAGEQPELNRASSITAHSGKNGKPAAAARKERPYRRMPSFGEARDSDKKKSPARLLSSMRTILRSGREGMLKVADPYYESKGHSRQPSWPDAIANTVEECMATTDDKLQDYRRQVEAYHQESKQQFEGQIVEVFSSTHALLRIVMEAHHDKEILKRQEKVEAVRTSFSSAVKGLGFTQAQLQEKVTPDLCEESKEPILLQIHGEEQEFFQQTKDKLESYPRAIQAQLCTMCMAYFSSMKDLFERIMARYEDVILLSDLPDLIVKMDESHFSVEKPQEQALDLGEVLLHSEKPWLKKTAADANGSADQEEYFEPGQWPHCVADDLFKSLFPALFDEQATTASTQSAATGPSRSTTRSNTRADVRRRPSQQQRQRPTLPKHYNDVQKMTTIMRDWLGKRMVALAISLLSSAEAESHTAVVNLEKWNTYWTASLEGLRRVTSTLFQTNLQPL